MKHFFFILFFKFEKISIRKKKKSKNQTFTLLINSFSHELLVHQRLLPDGTPYKKLLLRY